MPNTAPSTESFEMTERDIAGRIGRLRTKSGTIETPALFPVVNHLKKTVPTSKIARMGYQQIIANAYLISKHSATKARRLGLHELLGFKGVIMTDSGAYQLLSHGHVEVKPAEIIAFQEAIGSDIAVILDVPTPSDASREEAEHSVTTTINRAKESIKLRKRSDILWSGPVQGGMQLDLVERSAKAMAKLPFDVYAIGSPTTIMEQYQYKDLVDLIMTAKRHLPLNRPIHLFGAGHPAMFALAVAMGCDLFDSAAYALYAREERYLTTTGTMHLEELRYLPCECPVCVQNTASDLAGLAAKEREKRLAEHNLYVSIRELRAIKQSIHTGTIWEHVRLRCMSHPKLWEGFLRLSTYSSELEPYDPLPDQEQSGITFTGEHDLSRPEVLRHQARLLKDYKPPEQRKVLVLIPAVDLRRQGLPPHLEEHIEGVEASAVHICMYSPPFGIVPVELAETFPLSQYIATGLHSPKAEHILAKRILEYAERHFAHYEDVIIFRDDSAFTDDFYSMIEQGLKKMGLHAE